MKTFICYLCDESICVRRQHLHTLRRSGATGHVNFYQWQSQPRQKEHTLEKGVNRAYVKGEIRPSAPELSKYLVSVNVSSTLKVRVGLSGSGFGLNRAQIVQKM